MAVTRPLIATAIDHNCAMAMAITPAPRYLMQIDFSAISRQLLTPPPISTPPPAYMDIIAPLIATARDFLEAGEQLAAFAFVGNLTTKNVMPVPIDSGSETSKDTSALSIESAAA